MARRAGLAFVAVGALLLLASIGYVVNGKLRGSLAGKTAPISPYAVPEEHLAKHPGEFCFHVHPNGDAKFSKRTCAHEWESDDDDVHSMDAMLATFGPVVWFHEELEASAAAAAAGEDVVDEDFDDELFLPRSGVRLYSEHGLRVHALHEIPVEGHVYVVPQGLHFVWPMHGVGHSFEPQTMKEQPVPGKPIRLIQISESPRAFTIENFMNPEEMKALIDHNRERVAPSEVGFAGKTDSTRTSSTSWDFHSAPAKRVQKRAFDIIGWDFDAALADAVQVLNYEPSQWYKPHTDWFDAKSYKGHDPTVNNGTNRFATVFLYLNDVDAGGHTVFPLSRTHEGYNGEYLTHKGTEKTPGYISNKDAKWVCNESSPALRAAPVAGNAVLFYSQGPDGTLDKYSLHGGCPVIEGHKWSANVWIWNRPKPGKDKALDGKGTGKKKDGGIDVTFVNNAGHAVYIYWDNQSGAGGPEDDGLTPWGKYEAEEQLAMHTFPGHMFVFKEADQATLIRKWVATNKDGTDIPIVLDKPLPDDVLRKGAAGGKKFAAVGEKATQRKAEV